MISFGKYLKFSPVSMCEHFHNFHPLSRFTLCFIRNEEMLVYVQDNTIDRLRIRSGLLTGERIVRPYREYVIPIESVSVT